VSETAPSSWRRALAAAALFAVDPAGLGGISLRAFPGPARDRWLSHLLALLPPGAPVRRVPAHAGDDRLLGGLDLAATLSAGRPVTRSGLLAEADGGVAVLAMAERLSAGTAARVAAALDSGEIAVERDGMAWRAPARFGVVALDEGLDEEAPPAPLLERLAFRVELDGITAADWSEQGRDAQDISAARDRLHTIRVPQDMVEAVAGTAMALGIASLRAPIACLGAARAAAALAGRATVADDDLALACALVLAPRATTIPAAEPEPAAETPPPPAENPDSREADATRGALQDVVLEAARAAIPPGLLAALLDPTRRARPAESSGRSGAARRGTARGRPTGARAGQPPRDGRLHVLETLRAAAPWQRLRGAPMGGRIAVRRDDFRVIRTERRTGTTTIFLVDASGSAALNRLAETKGAVELMLADCYARRDRVAVVAFRGGGAELLLPPTRALARAKRSLAGLPGGGGTPLAAGLQAAFVLADAARRRGESAGLVLLTDGRANVALDGTPGRGRAAEDAEAVARLLRAAGFPGVLVDTGTRPSDAARRVAEAMGARHVGLPYADPAMIARVARDLAA
jgi:magnesium chelatase subunit D